MTIQEFTDRIKLSKAKDLELIFRTSEGVTLEISRMVYGVKDDKGAVTTPQVGEEPNCVVVSVV